MCGDGACLRRGRISSCRRRDARGAWSRSCRGGWKGLSWGSSRCLRNRSLARARARGSSCRRRGSSQGGGARRGTGTRHRGTEGLLTLGSRACRRCDSKRRAGRRRRELRRRGLRRLGSRALRHQRLGGRRLGGGGLGGRRLGGRRLRRRRLGGRSLCSLPRGCLGALDLSSLSCRGLGALDGWRLARCGRRRLSARRYRRLGRSGGSARGSDRGSAGSSGSGRRLQRRSPNGLDGLDALDARGRGCHPARSGSGSSSCRHGTGDERRGSGDREDTGTRRYGRLALCPDGSFGADSLLQFRGTLRRASRPVAQALQLACLREDQQREDGGAQQRCKCRQGAYLRERACERKGKRRDGHESGECMRAAGASASVPCSPSTS
jgi:hypothetical protein